MEITKVEQISETILRVRIDKEKFEIPWSFIPKNSLFHKFQEYVKNPLFRVEKDEDGTYVIPGNIEEFRTLFIFLRYGKIPADEDNQNTLIELLDQYHCFPNIDHENLDADMYWVIQYANWIRQNFNNPESGVLKDPHFGLMKLDQKTLESFELFRLYHMSMIATVGYREDRKSSRIYAVPSAVHGFDVVGTTLFAQKPSGLKYTAHQTTTPRKNVLFSKKGLPSELRKWKDQLKKMMLRFHELSAKQFEDWNHPEKRIRSEIRPTRCTTQDPVCLYDLEEVKETLRSVLDEIGIFDWKNIALCGGSVVEALRGVRENIADLDFFIYGTDMDGANDKLRALIKFFMPRRVVRTGNSITFSARCIYGYKGWISVQVILRIYKSISEILHGFDVDSCQVAFDGKEIYMTQAAKWAFENCTNIVNLDRASPTYEQRLSKYMQRGFGVYIPGFDPKKVIRKNHLQTLKSDYDLKLTGLSYLLRSSYYDMYGIRTRVSDYSAQSGVKPVVRMRWDIRNVELDWDSEKAPKKMDLKVGKFTAGAAGRLDELLNKYQHIYVQPPERCYYLGAMDAVAFLAKDDMDFLIPKDLYDYLPFKIPQGVEWKIQNPGEQLTNTFHRTVIENPNVWYEGTFYGSGPEDDPKEPYNDKPVRAMITACPVVPGLPGMPPVRTGMDEIYENEDEDE